MVRHSIDKRGELLIVCGLSGSGKSTLARHVLRVFAEDLRYMNTITTRPRRDGEDDVEYTFVSKDQYECIKSAATLWDESYVYGNYYGLDPSRYIEGLEGGQNFIVCTPPDTSIISPMAKLYGDSTKTIHIATDRDMSAERVAARNIGRDLSRIAIDAAMFEGGFRPDFTFNPSGDLTRDGVDFVKLIKGVIYE